MKLFPHQIECLEQTEGKNRVAYYLDMGLGKTFVGSEKMFRLGCKLNLIVCQKSKIDDWVDHFQKEYGVRPYNLTNRTELNHFDGRSGIAVINYELVWRRPELLNLENFTLMLDESSLIQNTNSKRTDFILRMKPTNVILLSGTPTGGKYENLWSQLHLLGWTISEQVYDTHYVNYRKIDVGGHIHKIVDKDDPYKNVDRLKAKMREHGSVFIKTEEVMELPNQNFQIIKVKNTVEYAKFKDDRLIELPDREMVGDSLLSYRTGLRQLCGAYNQNKVEAFKDLCSSTQERLVVFYNFNSELTAMLKVLTELEKPVSIVNGETKDLTAYETESNAVCLVQYKAGSMGLNLQQGNRIVYFSLTEESELFEQSKKRIHRIGQTKPCFYYLLVVKNSIEEQEILPTLNIRKELTDELFKKEETDTPPWD